jgi:hypothetical protein
VTAKLVVLPYEILRDGFGDGWPVNRKIGATARCGLGSERPQRSPSPSNSRRRPQGAVLGVHVGPHRARQIGVAEPPRDHRDKHLLHVHDAGWRTRRAQDPLPRYPAISVTARHRHRRRPERPGIGDHIRYRRSSGPGTGFLSVVMTNSADGDTTEALRLGLAVGSVQSTSRGFASGRGRSWLRWKRHAW